MARPPPLGPRSPSEPFSHPPGAPRELDATGDTICIASGEESIRSEQAQKLGQDSLDPPEHFQGGPRGLEPVADLPRLPAPSSLEESAGAKNLEHPISSREVLQADQDSLHLCLLGLGLWLQDLERGLGPCVSAQSRMVQLQRSELAQRSEPQTRAALEQLLKAFRAHQDSIFRQLWRLQAQLVSTSLVLEEASTLEQDLEFEGDSDGPGPGGVWGPWAPSSLPTPAELEWDPAGDVGDLEPLGRRTARMPGAPCELCGHRGPQSRGQSLEVRAGTHTSLPPQDMLMSGLSHRKHIASHRRQPLLWKSRDRMRQASPSLQDVMLEAHPGVPTPSSRRPLTFFHLLLLFLFLVGITLFLPMSGGSCCSPSQLIRTPYLELSYVNGPPPM
ncbi:nesprin-4 [Ovis aries]|uniref:nesprin-4 n=1 Tax=Ovis aries TaxID=9940 RepID=UPI0029527CA2|nr:nesprin-4 [Ovis aries]